MSEIQLIILQDGKEVYKAKLEGELRSSNPVLSYDEDSYEELTFSEDISISAIESLLEAIAECVRGDA